jgi:hypothetical protein
MTLHSKSVLMAVLLSSIIAFASDKKNDQKYKKPDVATSNWQSPRAGNPRLHWTRFPKHLVEIIR